MEECKKMSEDLMLERLRRMDHKFDGLIEGGASGWTFKRLKSRSR
jgi:hypothetical protein